MAFIMDNKGKGVLIDPRFNWETTTIYGAPSTTMELNGNPTIYGTTVPTFINNMSVLTGKTRVINLDGTVSFKANNLPFTIPSTIGGPCWVLIFILMGSSYNRNLQQYIIGSVSIGNAPGVDVKKLLTFTDGIVVTI